jgi:phage virion morphogenesis protein
MGAGIEVTFDEGYETILNALAKAAHHDKQALLRFVGDELKDITETAFEQEADPSTGTKWEAIKPRGKGASEPGSTSSILQDHGELAGSIRRELIDDAVMVGSPMVYAGTHQHGSNTGWHGSSIPARPYLGKPADFERRLLNDPYVQSLLGIVL